MESREPLPLEQFDSAPLLREQGGGCGAGRAPSNNDNVNRIQSILLADFETTCDVLGNRNRLQWFMGPLADTRHLEHAGRNFRFATAQKTFITDSRAGDFSNADPDFKFIFKAQRPVIVERCSDAR